MYVHINYDDEKTQKQKKLEKIKALKVNKRTPIQSTENEENLKINNRKIETKK